MMMIGIHVSDSTSCKTQSMNLEELHSFASCNSNTNAKDL